MSMNKPNVSLLSKAAATKAGKFSSVEIVGEQPYSGQLICVHGWSPTVYNPPRRHKDNFERCEVLAFDIDNGPRNRQLTLNEAVELMDKLPYAYSITTTASHQKIKNPGLSSEQPPKDRYRIVVFTNAPITSTDDYRYTFDQTIALLGLQGCTDAGAKDAARWFVASTSVVKERLEGAGVPLCQLAEVDEEKECDDTYGEITTNLKGALNNKTMRFLLDGAAPGSWHQESLQALMNMKSANYTKEEAIERHQKINGVLDDNDMQRINDVYDNRDPKDVFKPKWPRMSVATRTKPSRVISGHIDNLEYLVNEIMRLKLSYNKRNEDIYVRWPKNYELAKSLTDLDLAEVVVQARKYDLSPANVSELLLSIAAKDAEDPLLDALDRLQWDGKERMRELFNTIELPKDTDDHSREWYYTMLRRWIIGIVKKAYHPGSENNVLVFQGGQGAGKSSWFDRFKILWEEGYGEGSINPDNKDHELRHLDNFLWNVSELDATFNTKEVGALKDFFTKKRVQVRRPYNKKNTAGSSVCSFCASVNAVDFLRDPTGNRRYLVIPVVSVRHDHKIDLLQVYAEAKYLNQQGERNWFNREEILIINDLNTKFLSEPDYIERLRALVEPGDDVMPISEIFKAAIPDHYGATTQAIRSNVITLLLNMKIPQRREGNTYKFLINRSKLTKPSKNNQVTGL